MLSLNSTTKYMIAIFDSVNHHTTDLYLIVTQQMKKDYPKIKCLKEDFNIAIHENHDWGETLFDINWTKDFLNAFSEVYPEATI